MQRNVYILKAAIEISTRPELWPHLLSKDKTCINCTSGFQGFSAEFLWTFVNLFLLLHWFKMIYTLLKSSPLHFKNQSINQYLDAYSCCDSSLLSVFKMRLSNRSLKMTTTIFLNYTWKRQLVRELGN